ncbi:hypothetical protein IE53DRAFT_317083 [Violaceomyces palustris]|uniref:Uncharacterized protein n=1 Tax=Violaceomyces palustris TaxID=1673888 RepID=A0ACD0NVJ4_9BASI|nr:hypothetical protein IE53DRAFT_317083 [Violaceomyces palustris]
MYDDLREAVVVTKLLADPSKCRRGSKEMGRVNVILVTIGSLYSSLITNYFHEHFPMSLLIVDEASQVTLGTFPHLLNRHKDTLARIVFFGDDKQLAPHNAESLPSSAKSIFEMKHLSQGENFYFLDICYRLPLSLAKFISQEVYGGKLKSSKEAAIPYLRFIDVRSGKEEKFGSSWRNHREADFVTKLVKKFYKEKKFSILTPYDAQRSLIEEKLRKENLPSLDAVFNIDTFQGRESPIILISLVRTGERIGFLNNQRRANVCLTRTKDQMIVVTSKSFLFPKRDVGANGIRESLFSKLAMQGGPSVWLSDMEVSNLPDSDKGGFIPLVPMKSIP